MASTEPRPPPIPDERPLTSEERRLARWMLEHGVPDARVFVAQLDAARVVSRCACGCASIDLEVDGRPAAPHGAGMRILGDCVFGGEHDLSGVFIYAYGGVLSGIEVYGLAGDTPRTLPAPESLERLEPSP